MKVIDEFNDEVYVGNVKEVFEFNGGNWKRYFNDVKKGSFVDKIDFEYEDIDRSIISIVDDGEEIHLKDGRWIEVCWRGEECRVWEVKGDKKVWLNSFVK